MSEREQKPDVWVGLRLCGCCVAVVVDRHEHLKDVNASKREWVRDGLQVLHATWQEWLDKYRPSMGEDCTHGK